MIRKLFGNRDGSQSEKLTDPATLERLLAEIAVGTPDIEWIALANFDGMFIGSFPSRPKVATDTIAAMGAAMSSLGKRIASELKDGQMQYILVAGTNGISMAIELNSKYLLVIGLKADVSIGEFLVQLQQTFLPLLMKNLQLERNSPLSGIGQK